MLCQWWHIDDARVEEVSTQFVLDSKESVGKASCTECFMYVLHALINYVVLYILSMLILLANN